MICYFDSSFVLSAILEERPQGDHEPWNTASERLSSDLLRYECWTAIRRVALLQPTDATEEWVTERMSHLERFFEAITFKSIDSSIEAIARREPKLARCRTLDAIHVSTALYLSPHLEELPTICTFDRRMRDAASALGFTVSPGHE